MPQEQAESVVETPLVVGEPLGGQHLGQRAVGTAVRRNWPDEGGWFGAVITEHNPALGASHDLVSIVFSVLLTSISREGSRLRGRTLLANVMAWAWAVPTNWSGPYPEEWLEPYRSAHCRAAVLRPALPPLLIAKLGKPPSLKSPRLLR